MKYFPWQILLDWFIENGRHDFPWRQYTQETDICHRIWLAEILLQQTQADRVIVFYDNILKRFPNIQTLSETSYEEFFPFYQGLGYYSRARNLLKTAKIIHETYNGLFPKNKILLKKLPGIGEYTARAILAFGYGEKILAWDTNLETIFSRYYKGDKSIKLNTTEKEIIEKQLQYFLQHSTGNTIQTIRDINNALMDWSRISEPKNATLLDPQKYIFSESEFYITKGMNEFMEKKIASYFPIPDAEIIVTIHQDHQIYYSVSSDSYIPFTLPPSGDRATRKYTQDYFREKYSIELSVRPIHKKWISEDGIPYIAVNAQIQIGNIAFTKWNKKGEKLA